MNNHQLTKLTTILLTSISLLACNGGNSSSNTDSATTANPLQQYINLLSYTPANGKQLSTGSNQQSFSTPGGIQINSVDIKYYSGAGCSGTPTLATTLNGPSTLPAGTYTSTNVSNYALCNKYSGNCIGLYNAVNADPPTVRSMQYTYNLESGAFTTQCLSNVNNNPFSAGAFEAILNYSQNPPVACTSGSSCGYSQAYAATSLFTPIALPQSGQTPTAPLTATGGMDGYTHLGVPWAYVTSGSTTPETRFSIGTNDSGGTCPSGQEVRNDNLTGLMWIESPTSTDYKWQDATVTPNIYPALAAVAVINASGYCGYSDWRLPNVNELASLVNWAQSNTATWLNQPAQGFSNVQPGNYWSSTTYAASPSGAWVVSMGNGFMDAKSKTTTTSYVWVVRGG